jgi:hypothetical protein
MVLGAVAAAAAIVVLGATPALAIGNSSIAGSTGNTYAIQSNQSKNLVVGAVDDQLYHLGTGLTGINHLPFALHLYGSTYKNIFVSSNGNIQFGGNSSIMSAAFSNNCLPSSSFTAPTAMAFWDDLFFDSNDLGHFFREGIYVTSGGTAPHRKFTVSWQGHRLADSGAFVLAQARFFEGSNNYNVTYGASGGFDATIGVQSAAGGTQHFTQFSCNPGFNNISSGERLSFIYSP